MQIYRNELFAQKVSATLEALPKWNEGMCMRLKVYVAAGFLACCMGSSGAQMAPSGPGAPMGSPVEPAKAQDILLNLFEGEVMGVVKAMPADKFNFAPSAGTFAPSQEARFAGVRTFAQQAIHLAQANYFFFASFPGMKPDVDVKSLSGLKTKEEIVSALAASFVFAHKAVATITPANAYETIKGVDGMETRATVASFSVAHGFDHYGQLVEYLRMNGVVPPGSK